MKGKLSRFIGFFLLIIASLFITDGLYIKAKGLVAQHLLKNAWQQSIAHKKTIKPWPWADTWPVARLQVERLGIDCIVLEGDSGEVLAFGPGHLSSSAKPVASGNCALVGHRDTSFSFLKDLEKGDMIVLQDIRSEKRSYQIVSTFIKNQKELFLEETVTPWLTLITCYPLEGVRQTDMRYVVFAKEIQMSIEKVSQVNLQSNTAVYQ